MVPAPILPALWLEIITSEIQTLNLKSRPQMLPRALVTRRVIKNILLADRRGLLEGAELPIILSNGPREFAKSLPCTGPCVLGQRPLSPALARSAAAGAPAPRAPPRAARPRGDSRPPRPPEARRVCGAAAPASDGRCHGRSRASAGSTTGSLVVTAGFLRVELGADLLRDVRESSGSRFQRLGVFG